VRLDRQGFLDRCRALGIRADFWVVNDPDDARRLLAAGATGVMSDDPARLAPVFEEFR
jgi:glycerophosphoryl diester phosphodiesterase